MTITPLYAVTVAGQTYRIKEELKEWGFRYESTLKTWTKMNATQGEVNMFKAKTRARLQRLLDGLCTKHRDAECDACWPKR